MSGAVSLGTGAAAGAADALPQVVVTAVLDHPDGPPTTLAFRRPFDTQQLNDDVPQDTTGGSYFNPNGSGPNLFGVTGVALRQLIISAGVDLQSVAGVDVDGPTRESALASAAGDFVDPTAAGFPFTYDALPLLVTSSSDVTLWVGQRTPASAASYPDLANGTYFSALDGQVLGLVLHLSTTLAHATITSRATSVKVDTPVEFTGSVTDVDTGNPLTWTWDFADSGTAGPAPEASVSHTFRAPGHYVVTATVRGQNGSAGTATFPIDVTGSTTTPPRTTTPPAGPDRGTGATTAPNVGPREGSGPRVGGAPATGAGGRPGPSADPRSSSGVASATGTTPLAGNVVGYALSDADGLVQDPRAAVVARDNSAPAARDGIPTSPLASWVVGVLIVAGLLAIGAAGERRRPPGHRRRR